MRILVLFLVLLVGCSPIIQKGHISGKNYIEAHTDSIDVTVGEISVPITTYVPDKWFVTFKNKTEAGEVSRTIQVSKEEYDRYQTGDWIELKSER